MSTSAMSTLFVPYLLSLVYSLVPAGLSLHELVLVFTVLVILCLPDVLHTYCPTITISRCLKRFDGLRNNLRLFTLSSFGPAKTSARPQPRSKTSNVSRAAKLPANPTVQVDLDAFQKLTQERLQLHLKAKASERNTATLRSRIWFLEEANEALRADITGRVSEQERLAGERDWVTGDRDRAVEENDTLRAEVELLKSSKDGLVADLEELEAENEDLMAGKEALLTEKMAAEKKLASESTRRRQAETQATAMQHERDALESQLASKQETLNDLVDESDALEKDLQTTKRTLKDTQCDLVVLRATHAAARAQMVSYNAKQAAAQDEITALKAELEALRNSTCPISEVDFLRAEVHSTKQSLAQLRAEHEEQSASLDLCRAALRSTSEERDHLRESLDAMHARNQLAADLEDTLLQTLEQRDVEISALETTLADRDTTIAAHETALADRDATICTREAALADRDAALAQADAALAVCEASFAERDAAAAANDKKLVDLQTYVAGLEGVIQFLKLEASATRLPGTPVKITPKTHSASASPASSVSVSPSRFSLWRSTSTAPSSAESSSTPTTPETPTTLILPSRSSSSTSSPISSPSSDSGSPRRSWFF